MGKQTQAAQWKRVEIADAALKSELEDQAEVNGEVSIFERSLCVDVSVFNPKRWRLQDIIDTIEGWDYGHTPVGGWVLAHSENSPTVAHCRKLEFMREA